MVCSIMYVCTINTNREVIHTINSTMYFLLPTIGCIVYFQEEVVCRMFLCIILPTQDTRDSR